MTALLFCAFSFAAAQSTPSQERVIEKYTYENEPLEVVELASDGKTISVGEKFVQNGDWLKDFTIRYKNTSGKTIVYISVAVLFPETGPNELAHFIKYGFDPLAAQPANRNKPQTLAANQTVELKLTATEHEKLKKFLLMKSPLSDLTKAQFRISMIVFEDGTKWGGGTMFRPDPDNPGKFVPVDTGFESGKKTEK